MMRLTLAGCAAAALLWLAAGSAHAQYFGRPGSGGYGGAGYNPYGRPQLSPYLNLLRGGDPAANYYAGVLPAFQQRAVNAQYGSAIVGLDQRVYGPGGEGDIADLTNTTGHPTAFLNTASYFGALNAPRVGPVATGVGRRGR
jgi:hypothetical protein